MAKLPFTWKPADVVEVANVSGENILLELPSGPLRLDAGRTTRLTGSALAHPQLKQLLQQGKVKAEKFDWRKRR